MKGVFKKMENEYTDWFQNLIMDKKLQPYFEMSLPFLTNLILDGKHRKCIEYVAINEIQDIYVNYIAPIEPKCVDFKVWDTCRIKKIETWGNQESLNRIYVDMESNNLPFIEKIPFLVRDIELGNFNQQAIISNFKLEDGNHRFAFASQNQIPTVISKVVDQYHIHKKWILPRINTYKKYHELHLSGKYQEIYVKY